MGGALGTPAGLPRGRRHLGTAPVSRRARVGLLPCLSGSSGTLPAAGGSRHACVEMSLAQGLRVTDGRRLPSVGVKRGAGRGLCLVPLFRQAPPRAQWVRPRAPGRARSVVCFGPRTFGWTLVLVQVKVQIPVVGFLVENKIEALKGEVGISTPSRAWATGRFLIFRSWSPKFG